MTPMQSDPVNENTVTGYGLSLYSDPLMAVVTFKEDNELEGVGMPDIDDELAAYEKMREDLELHHMGKWVLVHEGKLIGTFDKFEDAASLAVARFGRGPYLIRQVGAPPVVLPASVAYRLDYGSDKVRV